MTDRGGEVAGGGEEAGSGEEAPERNAVKSVDDAAELARRHRLRWPMECGDWVRGGCQVCLEKEIWRLTGTTPNLPPLITLGL